MNPMLALLTLDCELPALAVSTRGAVTLAVVCLFCIGAILLPVPHTHIFLRLFPSLLMLLSLTLYAVHLVSLYKSVCAGYKVPILD